MSRVIRYACEYASEHADAILPDDRTLVADFDSTPICVVVRVAVLSEEEADAVWEAEDDYYGENDKEDSPLTIDMWEEYLPDGISPQIIELVAGPDDYLPIDDGAKQSWLLEFISRYNLAVEVLSKLESK
jgi:hypothetical protein